MSFVAFHMYLSQCFISESRKIIIPETTLATVPLTFPKNGYRQVGKDDILHMLLPQRTLYPNSRIYVPVFLEQPENEHGPISAIVIRYTHNNLVLLTFFGYCKSLNDLQ